MFISVLELFKIGIGPSSSHTNGPMVAAKSFINKIINENFVPVLQNDYTIQCVLKGSLAFTGKGHGTDKAVLLGLNGYSPEELSNVDVSILLTSLETQKTIELGTNKEVRFSLQENLIFDFSDTLPEHPNGMIFKLLNKKEEMVLSETYFSIGGGFISTLEEMNKKIDPLKSITLKSYPFNFDSAASMLERAKESKLSIAAMKRINELEHTTDKELNEKLDAIWETMKSCIERGLKSEGILPGGLKIQRHAKRLYTQYLNHPNVTTVNDWLCAYAMAVNEENAAGHTVVTAPTNGAAGVMPAVLYYFVKHEGGSQEQVREFLLTASAIGGIIKHRSSISGAEVGCQGEVGSAASMTAAGLCAVRGGSPEQIENAAEIALEHHLGMTCDPVNGLVQVPCIERNGFGAIKAFTAASLALRGTGEHFMPLDSCIAAMKQTGHEMSEKYKETSKGGLAVSYIEC